MNIKLLRKEEQSAGMWAGGTTTQLAIWPPESDYKRRDFLWRVSTARVDLKESVFTYLPGFHRFLMILEGEVRLTYKGRRKAVLGPFGQDEFEGDWTTISRGRCVDFNLMTAPGCEGRLTALPPVPGEAAFDLFAPLDEERKLFSQIIEAVYCLRPGVLARVREGDEKSFEAVLEQGDFLLLQLLASHENSGTPRAFFGNVDGDLPWGVRATIKQRV
ncbi:MAG: HutD family protein [Synergistaceae bacterium]|nr:HutD family protein [Synergistaceae bacterium]